MGDDLPTWLIVAAEEREFDGIREHLGKELLSDGDGAKFAREVIREGVRWWLIANGPGPRLVKEALEQRHEVNGIISTGFCGALDPALSHRRHCGYAVSRPRRAVRS